MERLRIRFLYRRGDRVGYGAAQAPCTVLSQRYQTREGCGPLITYLVEDAWGGQRWANEADLAPLRANLS